MDALGVRMVIRTASPVAREPQGLARRQADDVGVWAAAPAARRPGLALRCATGPSAARTWRASSCRVRRRSTSRPSRLPDGPERRRDREAREDLLAYMPYKMRRAPHLTDLAHPWVVGYRRPVFMRDLWQYVDVDTSAAVAKT